jgi:hypothetical protein
MRLSYAGTTTIYNANSTASTTGWWSAAASSVYFGTSSTTNFIIATGTSDRMTFIHSTGNVLVNTSTDNGGKLQVNGLIQGLNTFNRQTASYTLVIGDQSKIVEMNVASANNLTVPLNSSVAFAIGTEITIMQYGAGQTTIVAAVGVTLRSKSSQLKIGNQYTGVTLIKVGTDEWYVVGNVSA